jgi:hypothetical protein
MYASFLRILRALHLDVFEQPAENYVQQPLGRPIQEGQT